ncbi:peptidylprolyl isomerase, partial [Capnocytophaga canis]
GGNSDSWAIHKKRHRIGQYLLPPDTKKGFKHHRGVVSMPSSDIENPHKFASPYEFFIVVQDPGAYHLDGGYTAFGKVIQGMDVVDKISQVETDDQSEWPKRDVKMKVEILK